MNDSPIGSSDIGTLMVRPITLEDAEVVAALSGELGYEVTVEAICERIAHFSPGTDRQIALVACLGTEVVGWIEASIHHGLQSPPYSLINGLVVSETRRGLGIGKRLCDEVETWSRRQGVTTVRVTSRISREDAHRFYLREGFERIKTWAVFEKMLSK
jgi:GNAT superfamily N-acetyltransferase